jgi:RND family efflux transporter MFP subunit
MSTWKRLIFIAGVLVVAVAAFLVPPQWHPHAKTSGLAATTPASSPNKGKTLYWDPMLGPSSISDKPGISAMGMQLVPFNPSTTGPEVTIDPAVVQNMGVQTAPVTRGPLNVTIRAVGMLKVPEPGLHDISLKVGGWIDKLYADTQGMHVHQGEVLFDLYSPELQVAEEELISAVHSASALGPDASGAMKKEADGLVTSAKQKLRLWDVAERDIEALAKADHAPKTVPFRSPADGEILDKMIVQGSAVQPGMKLLRIENHSALWLDAEVYEQQIPMVSLGQEMQATVDALPGKTFTGKVSFIYPHLDHMIRTDVVRAVLDNAGMKLKPGMYATVNIIAQPVADAVLVPRQAVIDTGMKQIVFVAGPQGHFDPRNVRIGLAGDDQVQILEGVAPGEMVVTSGQFLMDVESQTNEAIEKLRE